MELFKNRKLYMPDMLEDGMRRGGEKAFALYQRADGSIMEISYAALYIESKNLLRKLQESGLQKGDRIGVIATMRPWWYSLLYAALKGNYRLVCMDPGLSAKQLRGMMRETEVRAVFTTLPYVDLPAKLEGRIPVYEIAPSFPLQNGCEKVDGLLASASPMPEETFFVLFSSGTTGERRKCVLLPHSTVTKAIEWGMTPNIGIYRKTAAYTVRKRDLMLFPTYHIAGLLCAVFDIYCNTQIIMLERLTPNALLSAMQNLQPDNICTVPSMLTTLMKKIRAGMGGGIKKKLLNGLMDFCGFLRRVFGWKVGRFFLRPVNKKAFGGKLKGFMVGGAPCDPETMRFYLNLGMDVALAYGLTELGAPLAVTGQGYYPLGTGRVLRKDTSMDIRCVNPDEKGRGEVEVLSPYRMIRYLDPEDNEGCFTEDGYFRTGDLGYFDKRNCLVICGRAKEAIVFRNGEKMLPEEIEKYYEDIKNVSELAVFRVPDEGGCDAFSIAVTKDTQELPDELIRLHVMDRVAQLSGNLLPKNVYVVHAMPQSSSHKVQRFRLTEMAALGAASPVTEEMLLAIDEDEDVAELRSILVHVAGSQWKAQELSEGLLLNLDSLQMMELMAEVQDRFGMDLYTLSKTPETFGELRDGIRNFSVADKNGKAALNLSDYPLKAGRSIKMMGAVLRKTVRRVYHVEGHNLDSIPEDEPVIFCANHVSTLDPGFIVSVLPDAFSARTAIVGKRDVLESKTLRSFAIAQNMIPVDRTGNSMPTLDRCRELLGEGWNILIFPEGTNYENATGTLMPLKEGPARLSIATDRRIVPVHLKGIARVDSNADGHFLPPVSKRIDVVFGSPISPGGKTPAEINEELRAAIEAL